MKTQQEEYMVYVILELLEVLVHSVLYKRSLYPSGVFEKRQKYNVATMMCRHPDVESYINDVIFSLKELIEKGNVEKMVVKIVDENGSFVERFCFEFLITKKDASPCYIELEAQLRAVLLKLNTCKLKVLSNDCSFEILAYTNMSSLRILESSDQIEKFPWIMENNSKDTEKLITPLRSCNTEAFKFQCYIETLAN